jgi:hypothetical protein
MVHITLYPPGAATQEFDTETYHVKDGILRFNNGVSDIVTTVPFLIRGTAIPKNKVTTVQRRPASRRSASAWG